MADPPRYLVRAREIQESVQLDACRIDRPTGTRFDRETGEDVETWTEVYAGPCRIRQANPAPQSTDAGEAQWAVDRVVVSLPWSDPASGAVVDGCTGTVTAAQDAAMEGLVVVAQAGHWQTDSTARRIPCQVVSRDAGAG